MFKWVEKESGNWVSSVPNFLKIMIRKESNKWIVYFLTKKGSSSSKELNSDNEEDAKLEVEEMIKKPTDKNKD